MGWADRPSAPIGARVSMADQDALWEDLCRRSDDPLIGVRLALQMQAGHLDVAGLMIMSCETLGESLETFLEYLPIIGQGGDAELLDEDGYAMLAYHPRFEVRRAERVELTVTCMLHLSRWTTGGQLQPEAIDFTHEPLDRPGRYEELLGCPVRFGQEHNGLRVRREMLDLPLIQANPTLRDQLRELADESLRALGEKSLSARVAELVRSNPQAGKERIGELLAMSGRHLNRCLAEEGFSFKQLRDRELQAMAVSALRRGEKITAVTLALGFSDESAFAKAFRRWTGVTPSQYRG